MRICYGSRRAVHRVEQAILIGRRGEPDDMPTRMLLLASDEAKYVDGADHWLGYPIYVPHDRGRTWQS